MPPVSQSREVLTSMDSGQQPTVSFGRKQGCFIAKKMAYGLGILFLVSLIVTGLLVYFYATPYRASPVKGASTANPDAPLISPVEASSTNVASVFSAGGTTKPPMKPTVAPVAIIPQKVMDVRLPRSIVPIKYLIKLQPLINGNFSIMGYTEITFKVMENTKNISIHMADMITKNHTVKLMPTGGVSTTSLGISQHKYDIAREFYVAMLEEELTAGMEYVLKMEFEGYLNDKLKGFYRSSYTNEAGEKIMLATTQFQPTDARRAFPCFDEPALKAEFEVYLARETNMTSISNMPRIETMPVEGQPGWVWDHFDTTVPMSTYLVAFVVSDFAHINATRDNPDDVLFRIWARSEAINQAEYSKEIGPPIQTFFEKYFDIPFPLPKQDMIALPDFSAGAMENWGLITYRETALLYTPNVSSASNKQRVAAVVSHELAHQWFGDLVTPSWWTDLWLNEGFASYLENLGVDAVETNWNMMEQFVISDLQSVFSLDCLESSHPISIPVGHPDEINEIFDRISYNKGASIIRMMNHFLGEPTLRKGLTNYLKHYKYKSAEQDNLWQFLTEQAHKDGSLPDYLTVKIIMDTWTLQMGYPVIDVMLNGDGSATVKQERFLLIKNENSTDHHDYKWWVPLNFASKLNPSFNDTKPSTWMSVSEPTKKIMDLPPPDNWVIFNKQQTGYYRVNYDTNNWKMIIQQLKSDHNVIAVTNRAQLIDDALDLARSGRLSYDIALDVNSYLSQETNYVPWTAALNNLGYIKNMLSRTAAYGAFKRYLMKQIVPLYNSVGFADNLNDPHLDQFKRVKAISWACSLGHEDCLQNAVSLYRKWMASPEDSSIISPNLKNIVFCYGIEAGGEDEWNFAWSQYLKSNVASEKVSLLAALGCTKQTWLLAKYLEMGFTKGGSVRSQDSSYVYRSVANNEVGRDLAWNYLRNNWEPIVDYFGSGLFSLGRLVGYASGKFNTRLMLDQLTDFKEVHKKSLGPAKRSTDQALERSANNVVWMEKYYPTIVKWLNDNGYASQ